jgi:hypothetical protein
LAAAIAAGRREAVKVMFTTMPSWERIKEREKILEKKEKERKKKTDEDLSKQITIDNELQQYSRSPSSSSLSSKRSIDKSNPKMLQLIPQHRSLDLEQGVNISLTQPVAVDLNYLAYIHSMMKVKSEKKKRIKNKGNEGAVMINNKDGISGEIDDMEAEEEEEKDSYSSDNDIKALLKNLSLEVDRNVSSFYDRRSKDRVGKKKSDKFGNTEDFFKDQVWYNVLNGEKSLPDFDVKATNPTSESITFTPLSLPSHLSYRTSFSSMEYKHKEGKLVIHQLLPKDAIKSEEKKNSSSLIPYLAGKHSQSLDFVLLPFNSYPYTSCLSSDPLLLHQLQAFVLPFNGLITSIPYTHQYSSFLFHKGNNDKKIYTNFSCDKCGKGISPVEPRCLFKKIINRFLLLLFY